MGSTSSKFRKHLQLGDEVQALQLYRNNSELRKVLDPNCSYGDSHQHETPLHLASKHGMQMLLKIFLFSKGGNPNKTNSRKETCLHCVCMETNWSSVHVCKRRAECLLFLLKWRGATLSEGQVEKIDLTAQDEKQNTALHYAASSGLTECVETLVQHGAPLFTENEDNLTPCDTAERNGHAQIALYLESKMVFSNEEEPQDEKDNVSIPPVEEYSGLRPQDLQEAKDQLLVETADMLSVPLFTAEALLRNHQWSREMLLEAWMTDPIACCEKCGVTPPTSLFSEKPQVQENLASPLPSPLHSMPTSFNAECNICANTFLIEDEPVHMTCTHQFCKDCWERYLNVKIQEGDAHHITCPAYDCTMLVPVDIIEGIVSRDMALRYLQFDIKAFVDSNPDMKWCPFPGCGRAVKLPDLDIGAGPGGRGKIPSDTSRGVDCGIGHYFCWECMEEAHEPCSCENWMAWSQKIAQISPEKLDGTEQETELAANCLWLVTNSKPCPNCKSPIQKNEGCNHMKCSKCKYDFCWVCLEQWKRHNSSTGGYFKCNRFEVVKKVEEQSANLLSEAETKNKNMQELNRFVHYYTRFKNHENSYKLEEPLVKTAKDKMMKLAEAVTDNATAHNETKFVEEAVQQLLKARRVLKCSYVYGYYLDGPGYKKIVFEFMQTELEECAEILSQMVNRLYLRTPRRKIIEQAHVVQRKRLEFITAIAKGLVPPETPPSTRKGKRKRKMSGEAVDEDLHRAIVASIQEVDPCNPWIKDASGRHTNVVALLEWPSDESEESELESELQALRDSIGKCHRVGCNHVRARNPGAKERHSYCSRWCMQLDKDDKKKDDQGQVLSDSVIDERMELLRALEMSRLQYLRDNGLLHLPDSRDSQQPVVSKSTQTRSHRHKQRPRSNSDGQGTRAKANNSGLSSMEELGIELQKFQELSSSALAKDKEDQHECRKSGYRFNNRHRRNPSHPSRLDESTKSTIVTRVPNKSVEDLYCLDQNPKSSQASRTGCGQSDQVGQVANLFGHSNLDVGPGFLADASGATATAAIPDLLALSCLNSLSEGGETMTVPSSTVGTTSTSKGLDLFGSMFGAIKDLSVSNIHANESDKTKDFLHKDLASIFADWDLDEDKRKKTNSSTGNKVQNNLSTKKQINRDSQNLSSYSSGKGTSGKSSAGKSLAKIVRTGSMASSTPSGRGPGLCLGGPSGSEECLAEKDLVWRLDLDEEEQENQDIEEVRQPTPESPSEGYTDMTEVRAGGEPKDSGNAATCADASEISLLKMAENLLQMTADVHSRMKEVEKGIRGLSTASDRDMGQRSTDKGFPRQSEAEMSEEIYWPGWHAQEGSAEFSGSMPVLGIAGDSNALEKPTTEFCQRKKSDKKRKDEGESVSNSDKLFFSLPKSAQLIANKDNISPACLVPDVRAAKPVRMSSPSRSNANQSHKLDGSKSKRFTSGGSLKSKERKEQLAIAVMCDVKGKEGHELCRNNIFPSHVSVTNAGDTGTAKSGVENYTSMPEAPRDEHEISSPSIRSDLFSSVAGAVTGSSDESMQENEQAWSCNFDLATGKHMNLSKKMPRVCVDEHLLPTATAPWESAAGDPETISAIDGSRDCDNIHYSLTRTIHSGELSPHRGDTHAQTGGPSSSGLPVSASEGMTLAWDSLHDDFSAEYPEDHTGNQAAGLGSQSHLLALISEASPSGDSDEIWQDTSSTHARESPLSGDLGDNENFDDRLDSVYV